MPPKVVAVAAGEAHTLALAGDGQVYSWGRGPFGRLGTGREDDELVPTAVAPAVSAGGTPRPRFVAVAAGAYHSLALDEEVWNRLLHDGSAEDKGGNLGVSIFIDMTILRLHRGGDDVAAIK